MSMTVLNHSPADTLPVYPFTALQGQSSLQLALKLVAVDPRLGGVLIEGARGTAKTTSARALADILPEGDFVNLPLGASEEQLLGSLDLELVLQQGKTAFQPGLLSRAHRGVLYVDEINLLADTLVDLLLDVCSSGINRIERDGLSHQHAADIVLIGTMNPEEGELRPQLLDRFGLYVSVDDTMDQSLRQTIVRSRLAFDDNPTAFVQAYAQRQQKLLEQLMKARQRLPQITFSDQNHELVAQRCHDAQVEGVRADLVMLRASRAMAALQGSTSIQPGDIEAIAELVLAHRRRADAATSDSRGHGGSDESGQSSQEADKSSSRGQDEPSTGAQDPAASAEQNAPAEQASTADDGGDGKADSTSGLQADEPRSSGRDGAEHDAQQAGAASSASMAREAIDRQWGAMPAQPVPVLAVQGKGGQGLKKP